MYAFALVLHSSLRWIVLALVALTALRAVLRLRRKAPWHRLDQHLTLIVTLAIYLQMSLGLTFYLTNPFLHAFVGKGTAALFDPIARFWMLEHPLLMGLAITCIHGAYFRVRWHPDPPGKYLRIVLFYTAALLLICAAIPWPFRSVARPLLRF